MVSKSAAEPVPQVEPATPPTPRAIHTAAQVLEALQKRYDGPIELVEKFKYIPWNVSVNLANEVFGFLGWSSSVLSCEYTECEVEVNVGTYQDPSYERRDFKGFQSIVRVGVQVYDEATGTIITTHHDGIGYGPIQGQGNKNPMDGAAKAAKSDGISTAIKHYGDAFGLFLYEKENKQGNASSGSAQTGSSYGNTSGGGGRTLSEKQAAVIISRCKLTQAQVSALPYATAKQMLDGLFGGSSPDEVMRLAGITPAPPTGDRLPIPR